jgi:hypothetical protein
MSFRKSSGANLATFKEKKKKRSIRKSANFGCSELNVTALQIENALPLPAF